MKKKKKGRQQRKENKTDNLLTHIACGKKRVGSTEKKKSKRKRLGWYLYYITIYALN